MVDRQHEPGAAREDRKVLVAGGVVVRTERGVDAEDACAGGCLIGEASVDQHGLGGGREAFDDGVEIEDCGLRGSFLRGLFSIGAVSVHVELDARPVPEDAGAELAILAVKEFAHRFPSSLVRFTLRLALVRVHAALRNGINFFGGAALRATVSEAGLVRFQLKLFVADDADFDRKRHTVP